VAADLGSAAGIPRLHPGEQSRRIIPLRNGTVLMPWWPAARPREVYILDMFRIRAVRACTSGIRRLHGHGHSRALTGVRAASCAASDGLGFVRFAAEQYAVKTGHHPRVTTEANIANFTRQIKSLGFSYDGRANSPRRTWNISSGRSGFPEAYNSWFNPATNKAEPIETLKYPAELGGDDASSPSAETKEGDGASPLLEAKRRAYRDSKRLAYVSEAL